ncbi:MAG: hypothetical protein FWC55_08225 [Firmicutes bacterium]|nr:hypothetical protein [Bacillota bacterium]
MNKTDYMEMLFAIDSVYTSRIPLILSWENGFKIKCLPFVGVEQSSMEPEDEGYYGEYYTVVQIIETLGQGLDSSVPVFNGYVEISLLNVPQKIEMEDGTVLWTRDK